MSDLADRRPRRPRAARAQREAEVRESAAPSPLAAFLEDAEAALSELREVEPPFDARAREEV